MIGIVYDGGSDFAVWIREHDDGVIAAAEARAADDIARGVANLKVRYAHSVEWRDDTKWDGRYAPPIPERQILAGQLRQFGIDPDSIELVDP